VNAESQKAARRKRKVRRLTPAIIEQRERKPFIFGWGADLDRRQREAIKERFALFAGIAIALVLFALLGWGWYQDNVAAPAAAQAKNNQIVATAGNDTVRYGFFHRFVTFQKNQLNTTLAQYQQQLQQVQASKSKSSAATASQLQAQISSMEQQLNSIATVSLDEILADYTLVKRSGTAGVPLTPKLKQKAMLQAEKPLGGRLHLINLLSSNNLTLSEFQPIIYGDYLHQLVAAKLAKSVKHYQLKVRASHILIAANNKKLAEKVFAMATSGQNFAKLAKKYSTDKSSAVKGGDLGYFAKGAMVPAFDKAVFSMKVGQFKLVKSQFGWHIIKLTGRKNAKLTATEYAQAQQQAFNTWLTKEESAIHVERIMDVTKIPGLQPTASALGSTGLPAGLTGATSNGQPVQVQPGTSSKAGTISGKTVSGSTGKSSSSTTSGKSGSSKGTSKK
jgi:parvulin-like peptidyl-prolyl isomerase